jgi:hypothetical protein
MQILKALAPRLSQTPVLQAVSFILAASDTQATSAAALSVGLAIAGRRQADGRFDLEDRPDLLAALSRIGARKNLGGSDAPAREKSRHFRESVIEDLFAGAKDLVRGAYEGLISIRDAKVLSKDGQQALERRLAELHSIALS